MKLRFICTLFIFLTEKYVIMIQKRSIIPSNIIPNNFDIVEKVHFHHFNYEIPFI